MLLNPFTFIFSSCFNVIVELILKLINLERNGDFIYREDLVSLSSIYVKAYKTNDVLILISLTLLNFNPFNKISKITI